MRSSRTARPSGSVPAAPARRTSATAKKSSRAGFTLIELVLVLVILAIAGALAVPALQPTLEATRIEAAARETAAFLDDTRRRSVLGRAVLLVRCDPQQRRLVVEGEGGAAAEVRDFPEAVSEVSCSPERMRYLPQGSADGMELVLLDARGRRRRLTVGAFTGLARVEAGP